MAREAGRTTCVKGERATSPQKLTVHEVNVDVDWMDPTYTKNLPIKPNDQTSNNLWVNQQMSHPENKDMVLQVCKELKSEGWKAAYTRIVSSASREKCAPLR
jgi:transaldolase